jgi:S-adenosylmethionine:tRNA-ribosyltransferase-isomerase (queuine synthetase)
MAFFVIFSKVKTMKEEVEYQKRQQGKVEVQLQDLLRVHEKCLINQAEKTLRQNKELEKLRCQLEDKVKPESFG